jgi:GntR family transcriptional regulator
LNKTSYPLGGHNDARQPVIVWCIHAIDNMFVTVDERDARPLYQQLVDEIKTLIARGELEEGTLLPPVRQVASDLGVNLNTVAFAYRRLQKEGLIRVRHGSGAVVISQTLREKPDDRLRAQLRTALTQLILAGLKPAEIRTLINEELDELLKEPRRSSQTS